MKCDTCGKPVLIPPTCIKCLIEYGPSLPPDDDDDWLED